ncbi:MAG: L-aspartate oxidase [Candidatus Polarisedimenticolia bacterium]
MKSLDLEASPASHDAILVGSGVAGLRAAIEAAEGGLSVALLAKDSAQDTNTGLAQGGVAVALSDEDQVGLHYSDTLAAGDGLCDEGAVAVLVGEGPRYITQLIEWGAQFDREGARLAFTREGAHSARRILHAHGDATGREILRALWLRASSLPGITFYPHTFSVQLLVEDGRCHGLMALDERTGRSRSLRSSALLLATGGLGQIYGETTNPPQATGDGIAIAWRAGAVLRDLEFVQFHPTSLRLPGAPCFLLSEALRGEGGVLRSVDGSRFMAGVDPRAELAPRDVVARAIVREMRRSGSDHVLLDMTGQDEAFLRQRFPGIHATCLSYGLDIARAPIPVAPAAHYAMGGIATDLWGRTSVPGLLAAGEVACTGVHGANRLASNSLLEGLVFGARAGQAMREEQAPAAAGPRFLQAPRGSDPAAVGALTRGVRTSASEHLGIEREGAGLAAGLATLREMLDSMPAADVSEPASARTARPGLEAANMAAVAMLIARAALAREESRGAHHRSDHPGKDDGAFGRSFGMVGEESPRAMEGALALR